MAASLAQAQPAAAAAAAVAEQQGDAAAAVKQEAGEAAAGAEEIVSSNAYLLVYRRRGVQLPLVPLDAEQQAALGAAQAALAAELQQAVESYGEAKQKLVERQAERQAEVRAIAEAAGELEEGARVRCALWWCGGIWGGGRPGRGSSWGGREETCECLRSASENA